MNTRVINNYIGISVNLRTLQYYSPSAMAATDTIPDFDDLPKVEGMPQGCAWGVFDKDGKKDLVGTLNFLTPDVVKAAAAEVKDGVSISLK